MYGTKILTMQKRAKKIIDNLEMNGEQYLTSRDKTKLEMKKFRDKFLKIVCILEKNKQKLVDRIIRKVIFVREILVRQVKEQI